MLGRRLARPAAIKADGRLDVVGEETIVTLVHKRKAAAPDALCLDLARVGPEISPRIYGQFIEHLDRCIYGGVWAEMLKDRKFLRPVGHDWQTMNPDPAAFEAVLDPAGAVAGTPCMALWVHRLGGPARGIRQSGLGLRAGQTYAGYAWLANIGSPASVQVRLAWGDGAGAGQFVALKA